MSHLCEIRHYKGLNHTPAFSIAVIGQAELVKSGLHGAALSLSWDHNAITAEIGGEAVGVIVWTKADHLKEVFVCLGFVLPTFRGSGIYRTLYEALVEKAREEQADHILGITHVNNTAMRAAAQSLGRTEHAVVLWHKL